MTNRIVFLIIGILCFFSCDDFFEKDLTGEKVALITPVKGNSSTDTVTYLKWDGINGASYYQIQIVTPGFSNIQKLLVDSTLEKTAISFPLPAGNYEWRVRAGNESSATDYTLDSFAIVAPFSIENVLIGLQKPANFEVSKSNLIEFVWSQSENVQQYNFVIRDLNSNDSIYYFENTLKTSIVVTLPDGTYSWGVAGVIREGGETRSSSYNTSIIIVNSMIPNFPTIISPIDKDTIRSNFVQFNWEKVQDSASYNFQLFDAGNLSTPLQDKWVKGTSNAEVVENTGHYVFRLRTKDHYGLIGDFSPFYNFYVKRDVVLSTVPVTLIAPSNDAILKDSMVNFYWEEIDEATNYSIQIVTPDFTTIERMVAGALTSENSYSAVLKPGDYSWRVKALSSNSETNYSVRKFKVYGTDLGSKVVNVYSPAKNALFNKSDITFSWEYLGHNCTYVLEVRSNDWANGEVVKRIETASISMALSLETGKYTWNVQAVDKINGEKTQLNIRSFEVDTEKPRSPKLISPSNNFTTDGNYINFSWANNSSDVQSNVVEIYKVNNSQQLMVLRETSYDTLFSSVLAEAGSYIWRVKAIDKAGNESSFTSYYSFKITSIPDISAKVVQLLSPSNQSVIQRGTITLWWDEVTGATTYNVQVVRSTFASPVSLELDTIVETTKLEIPLSEGSYEWRVKGMNEKTQTKYTTKSFTVYDDSFDKNSVQLISPENYKILNYNSLKFIWHDVEEASSYMLQVKKDNWSTGESFEQLTTADTVAAINLPDGVYYWGVKAINNNGLSTDYSYRKLEVDTKLPEIPTLLAPIDGFETALRNLSFSWKMGTGTIDNIVYQFEVHKIVAGVDQLLFTSSTSSTGIEYKFAETGSYYWRVRAVDLAGNLSQYSVSNSIIIKDEKDISAITVKLLSPADTISTTLSKITFWWEKVDGSTVYVFQLIRPNFTKPEELISDVEITTNQIIIDLPKKDSYQWRVKAKNGISETKYTTRTITLK